MPPTKIEEIEDKLTQLLFYIHNDNHTGRKGLVQEVSDIKSDISKVKSEIFDFMNKYKEKEAVKAAEQRTAIIVTSAFVSGLVGLIGWVLKIIFLK